MNGFVYFISNGEAVKIGYSADPAKRFQSLQTSQPGTLVLLGTIAGNRELERELHTRFADRRRVGEWFTADDVLIGAIEGLIANPPTIPSKRDRTRARLEDEALAQRVHAYLRQRHPENTASLAAAATGVDEQTVAKWFERNSLPNAEGVARCIVAYGPTFLAALLDPVPDWVLELIRLERRGEVMSEIRALMRELHDLNASLDIRQATGPPSED